MDTDSTTDSQTAPTSYSFLESIALGYSSDSSKCSSKASASACNLALVVATMSLSLSLELELYRDVESSFLAASTGLEESDLVVTASINLESIVIDVAMTVAESFKLQASMQSATIFVVAYYQLKLKQQPALLATQPFTIEGFVE